MIEPNVILKRIIQKDTIQAGVFLSLVLCIVFFSVIFMGKTIASIQVPGVLDSGPYNYNGDFSHRALIDPGGSTWSPRPQTILEHEQLSEGMAPLWNPYMGVGQPLAGSMDSNSLNPLRVLLYLNPSPYMWDIFLLFRLFLAGFFAYLFMRAINASHLSSLFSSLLFMLSGYFIFSIDMHYLDVEIFLPLIFLCHEKIVQKENILRWGLLNSFGVVLLLCGGQPQSAALILGFGFFYYVFRLLSTSENRNIKVFSKFLFIYIFFNLLGFSLSAPALLPFLEFLTLSINNHTPNLEHVVGLDYSPYFLDIISFIVPYFMGLIHLSWLNDFNWHSLTRGYWGVSTCIFALAAILATFYKKLSDNLLTYFFAIALILMISKLYGFSFINWVGSLPIANQIRFFKYMGPLMSFSSVVLAGIGLDQIVKSQMRLSIMKKSAYILTLCITFFYLYYFNYLVDHYDVYYSSVELSGIFSFPLPVVVLLMVLIAPFFMLVIIKFLKYCQNSLVFNGRKFQILVLMVALVELFIYIPNPGISKSRNDRGDIFNKAPYIGYLQNNLQNFRVVGIDQVLYPDFGSAFGISDIRVLDALLPIRYMEFIKSFNFKSPHDRFTGDKGIDFGDEQIQRALNLLGVKYILSRSDINGGGITKDIVEHGKVVHAPKGDVRHWIKASSLNINGMINEVLFFHAPSSLKYNLQVPHNSSLEFSIGMAPESWSQDKGDGVLFEITLNNREEGENKIFSKYIDPKNRPQDRKWFQYSINLSQYGGQEVTLKLTTYPGEKNDNSFDWSVWGGLKLKTPDEMFKLVYNHEVMIYENLQVFPRAFIVHDFEFASKPEEVLKRLTQLDFPLRDKIILEDKIPESIQSQLPTPSIKGSESKIIEYNSQHVDVHTNLKSPGFLVLSDLYYPGWNVFVDGKRTKMYQVDYIFRSVFLKEGEHNVRFEYEAPPFKKGMWIAGFSALFGVLLLLGDIFYRTRNG
ncbi:MAG: YfhO family protein [Nitrospinae bacterium]|nr:YfhO family protein [Nitrospinota bacterium]